MFSALPKRPARLPLPGDTMTVGGDAAPLTIPPEGFFENLSLGKGAEPDVHAAGFAMKNGEPRPSDITRGSSKAIGGKISGCSGAFSTAGSRPAG